MWVALTPGARKSPIELPGPDALTEQTLKWKDFAVKYAAESGVPASLVLGTIYSESGGKPTVTNFCCDGLMALSRNTWEPVYHLPPGGLKDPETNIRVGADVLRKALDMASGDIPTAVSIYNAGPAASGGAKKSISSPWGMVEDKPLPWKSHIEKVTRANNWFGRVLATQTGREPAPEPPPLTIVQGKATSKTTGLLAGSIGAFLAFKAVREGFKRRLKK